MKLKLFFAFALLVVLSSFRSDRTVTVFMIGDSTMANKSLADGNLERGWGHVLGCFFSEDVVVDNHAVNGRSSKSFIDEGRWDAVVSKIKKGDYVFIQFGHNDEKPKADRHTDPGTTFDANLEKFVREARAKGAVPVLFNAIVRRNYAENKNAVTEDDFRRAVSANTLPEGDTLVDTHGAYLDSPRNVAKKLGVVFVDANRISHDIVQSMGREGSKQLFMWIGPKVSEACPNGRQDNTHLNVYGAHIMASAFIDAVADAVPALGRYVRHYDTSVAKDGSGDFFNLAPAVSGVASKKSGASVLVRQGEYTMPKAPKGRTIRTVSQREFDKNPALKAGEIVLVLQTGAVVK